MVGRQGRPDCGPAWRRSRRRSGRPRPVCDAPARGTRDAGVDPVRAGRRSDRPSPSVRSIASWWSEPPLFSICARTYSTPSTASCTPCIEPADGVPRRADQVPPQRPERHHRCGGTNQDLGRVAAESSGRHQAATSPVPRSSGAASRTGGQRRERWWIHQPADPARAAGCSRPWLVRTFGRRRRPTPGAGGGLASFPRLSMRNASGSEGRDRSDRGPAERRQAGGDREPDQMMTGAARIAGRRSTVHRGRGQHARARYRWCRAHTLVGGQAPCRRRQPGTTTPRTGRFWSGRFERSGRSPRPTRR